MPPDKSYRFCLWLSRVILAYMQFVYSNRMERPVQPWLRAAALVHPGLRKAQTQIKTHAEVWAQLNERAVRHDGPLWVVMGDSLAQGVGASSPERGWVGQLQRTLAAHGQKYRLVNLSVSGDRIQDVLERQLPALRALGQPQLLTVLIGVNDLFSRKYRPQLPQNMRALLAEMPAGTILGTLPPKSPIARAANDVLHAEAAARWLVVADISELFQGRYRDKLSEDHAHPNDHGYADIARIFAEAIKQR